MSKLDSVRMSPVTPPIRLPAADIPVRTADEMALIRPSWQVASEIGSVLCRFGMLVGVLRSGRLAFGCRRTQMRYLSMGLTAFEQAFDLDEQIRAFQLSLRVCIEIGLNGLSVQYSTGMTCCSMEVVRFMSTMCALCATCSAGSPMRRCIVNS